MFAFGELAAGFELERADAASVVGAGRPGGDCEVGLGLDAEVVAELVDGAVGECEPVDGEEVDAAGAERPAPHGVGEADRHALTAEVADVGLEDAGGRWELAGLKEQDRHGE